MPPLNTRSALLNISDRLRKVFGMAGEIDVAISREVALTAFVADLTAPGSSEFRGKRFAIVTRADVICAATFGWVFRISCDAIITQIRISMAAANGGQMLLWYLTPDVAPVNAANVQAGTWLDGKKDVADLAPLFLSAENPINLGGETAPTSRNLIASGNSAGQAANVVLPVEMFVRSGTHIIYRRGAASATDFDSVGIYGKVA